MFLGRRIGPRGSLMGGRFGDGRMQVGHVGDGVLEGLPHICNRHSVCQIPTSLPGLLFASPRRAAFAPFYYFHLARLPAILLISRSSSLLSRHLSRNPSESLTWRSSTTKYLSTEVDIYTIHRIAQISHPSSR